jgi:hypothetical protein
MLRLPCTVCSNAALIRLHVAADIWSNHIHLSMCNFGTPTPLPSSLTLLDIFTVDEDLPATADLRMRNQSAITRGCGASALLT